MTANKAFYKLFNLHEDDVEGKLFFELQILPSPQAVSIFVCALLHEKLESAFKGTIFGLFWELAVSANKQNNTETYFKVTLFAGLMEVSKQK